MLLRPTIPAQAASDPALDQRQLYERGLAAIRRLSRHGWSDHNTHDPGITQLELFAYALTDLAFRARFPIADLLAAPADNAAAMAGLFASAARILPNAPLTLDDYRKRLIDLPGVRNAWLEAVPVTLHADPASGKLHRAPSGRPGERAIAVAGRYRPTIEYMDDVRSAEQRTAVRRAVLAALHAERGLGLDFVGPVGEIEPYWLSLCAEIDLAPEADVAAVAAAIRFAVDRFLAPTVPNYTLAEMLARRHPDGSAWTLPEIFAGPRLANGFIADEDLAAGDLRREVRLSDVISVVMDIPGVLAIRDLLLAPVGAGRAAPPEPAERWRLAVPAGRQPRLAELVGRLAFFKKNLPVVAAAEAIDGQLQILRATERAKLEGGTPEDWPIPLGRYRDPAHYHSVQAEFPALYGLSAAGLGDEATPQRRAQALQFKGWLTFFDHIMAGYAAQLAHVRDLFSATPALAASYFGQQVQSFPDWEKIYAADFTPATLAGIVEADGDGLRRRNRFLDHLLARHAEDFSGYVAAMQSRFGLSDASAALAKCRFLDDYPTLGGERSLGHDVTRRAADEIWNSSLNISGFERRVARLLDIANPARRNLSEIAHDLYGEVDRVHDNAAEYRFRIRHPVSGKVLLSSSTHYATPEAAQAEMAQAVLRGQLPEGYQRRRTGHEATPEAERRYYFNIVDASQQVIARRIEYFASAAAMEAAIAELGEYLRSHYSGEGMFVIEHLLLLGDGADDPLFDICTDGTCTECADLDPYSHRLSIVLPAYAGRFRDIDFRRFVEATLREELPAHLLARICWVNSADMAAIEGAWHDWLAIRAGAASADPALKLGRLIEALTRAKNVYPEGGLHPCGQLEPPPFILGRAALGSAADPPAA